METVTYIASGASKYPKLGKEKEQSLGRQIQAMVDLVKKHDPFIKKGYGMRAKELLETNLTTDERETITLGLKARELLILHNQQFVMYLAKRMRGRSLKMDDLCQLGMIGLIQAVENFDPTKNLRFTTYSYLWIRGEMSRSLMINDSQMKVTIAYVRKLYKISTEVNRYKATNKRNPTMKEIASLTGFTEHEVRTSLRDKYSVITLNVDDDGDRSPLNTHHDGDTLMDTFVKEDDRNEKLGVIQDAISYMPALYRGLMKDYYFEHYDVPELARLYRMRHADVKEKLDEGLELCKYIVDGGEPYDFFENGYQLELIF